MPLTTPVVAVKTTPTVLATAFSHFTSKLHPSGHKKRDKDAFSGEGEMEDPQDYFSYSEGLNVVKQFLKVAKSHSIEELQTFTAMHVPSPSWIHISHVTVPYSSIDASASLIQKHLLDFYGPDGLAEIGGSEWWRLRGRELEGEWIEMKKDYLARTLTKVGGALEEDVVDEDLKKKHEDKVILYIHGGAYFFSSLDTHRYQMQRHARLLGGRVFAPSYRLAPQYPFPCALHDALASYLFLIDPPANSTQPPIPPSSIILSGDSAGAGLCMALLCLIRDSGGKIPMPAGCTMFSPWVDLTHSFKSVVGDGSGDYIPSEGFHYKPSLAWPPILGPENEVNVFLKDPVTGKEKDTTLTEQIQVYTTNKLLSHPLVSPVNQGSLGGLCPLMIIGGGGELLRDEMIYLAHKAANPPLYPPGDQILAKYPKQQELVAKFPPTKVHLQIYDGCCHVAPTLSFTKPAKYMYRAGANFGLWAITAAKLAEQHAGHDHTSSHIHSHPQRPPNSKYSSASSLGAHDSSATSSSRQSTTSSASSYPASPSGEPTVARDITESVHEMANEADNFSDAGSEYSSDSNCSYDVAHPPSDLVTIAGAEPMFVDSMIRERVSVSGRIRPMESVNHSSTFHQLDVNSVGRISGYGPIVKWLAARKVWDDKHAKLLSETRSKRTADRRLAEQNGYLTRTLQHERPPLTALAGFYSEEMAKETGKSVDEVGRRGKTATGPLALWMKMGQKGEESRAKTEKVDEMEAHLASLGIKDEHAQATLGDKKPELLIKDLAEAGLQVDRSIPPPPPQASVAPPHHSTRHHQKNGAGPTASGAAGAAVEPEATTIQEEGHYEQPLVNKIEPGSASANVVLGKKL